MSTDNSPEGLLALRLPELQRRFAEVVGEPTRCPNRTYLVRRITETMEVEPEPELETEPEPEPEIEIETEPEPETETETETAEETARDEVAEWRARYLEVVGRPTGSSNVGYMKWKVRQAERGLIPIGPIASRRRAEAVDHKVLPLRLPTESVAALDEVWRRQGLRSRMDLFRRALHTYLKQTGEQEAAGRFEQAEP